MCHDNVHSGNMAEWLKRWPAKPVSYGVAGSNPAVVVKILRRVKDES